MRTHTVIARYWIDYRENSVSFESIPAALEFLHGQTHIRGVVIDKITLDCGTVVLSRGEIEQLNRPAPATRVDRYLRVSPTPAASNARTSWFPRIRSAASTVS